MAKGESIMEVRPAIFDPQTYTEDALVQKLRNIYQEQEFTGTVADSTTIGNVTASRDKHTAIQLILDYFSGTDVSFYFDQIR
jgi:hypothetical protein